MHFGIRLAFVSGTWPQNLRLVWWNCWISGFLGYQIPRLFFLWKKSNQLEVSIGKDAYEVGLIWLDQRRASERQPPTNREHTGVWPIRKDDELWSEGILLELGFPMFSVSWHDLDSLNCLRTQHRITGAQVRLNDKKNIFFFVFFEVFQSVMILQECSGYVLQDFLHIKNVLTFPRWLGKTWYKKWPPFHMCVFGVNFWKAEAWTHWTLEQVHHHPCPSPPWYRPFLLRHGCVRLLRIHASRKVSSIPTSGGYHRVCVFQCFLEILGKVARFFLQNPLPMVLSQADYPVQKIEIWRLDAATRFCEGTNEERRTHFCIAWWWRLRLGHRECSQPTFIRCYRRPFWWAKFDHSHSMFIVTKITVFSWTHSSKLPKINIGVFYITSTSGRVRAQRFHHFLHRPCPGSAPRCGFLDFWSGAPKAAIRWYSNKHRKY